MDPAVRRLIEAIHARPLQCVLSLTGGGVGAAAMLLEVPGGSRTVLEILSPYSSQALVDFLGHLPEHFCTPETARRMAERAENRARWLAPGQPVIGVGCTASLATDRPKKGDHRFHVAVVSPVRWATCSLTLNKGARDRSAEEALLDAVLLNALAEAFGIADRLAFALLPGEVLHTEAQDHPDPVEALLRGDCSAVRGQTAGS